MDDLEMQYEDRFYCVESDLDDGFLYGWESDDYTEDDMDTDTRNQREADILADKSDRADNA